MVKRITDFSAYRGTLPYASEIFGVYQPLLGWKSGRTEQRRTTSAAPRMGELLTRFTETLLPDVVAEFNSETCQVAVTQLAPAALDPGPRSGSVVAREVVKALPPVGLRTMQAWEQVLTPEFLGAALNGPVVDEAAQRFSDLCQAAGQNLQEPPGAMSPEQQVKAFLDDESRRAGVLLMLHGEGSLSLLDSIFAEDHPDLDMLESILGGADPVSTLIDPASDLKRVGLSPIGIAHLFRQYFFELDTFLGSPVGHVWVSPGSTVELFEVHTRRVLVEQTLEQSVESIRKSETSTSQQDDLSDAVKDDNKTNTKLGVYVSASETVGLASGTESASFSFDDTQQHAREQAAKTMRQQATKLSSEITQNFKTTFRTVTESTDTSSKRYQLTNATDKVVNYELRRKMREVAVQSQDIGSYLCWQTYVDHPGIELGVGKLVHVAVPPDLKIPVPDKVMPGKQFSQPLTIPVPILTVDGKVAEYGRYEEGVDLLTVLLGGTAPKIRTDVLVPPIRCPDDGFILTSVSLEAPPGNPSRVHVDPTTIRASAKDPDAYEFIMHLEYIDWLYEPKAVKATLYWDPKPDAAALADANAKRIQMFTAREQQTYNDAFVEESRKRITLASNIQPRRAEDLREEERVVIYRSLIQDLLEPPKKVPQPDSETRHVVAELLNAIFDVEKLLYFVAPEWWRPQAYLSHLNLGGLVTVNLDGKQVVQGSIPATDITDWSDAPWATQHHAPNYFITEDSAPAKLGSSLGWLLELDGDDLRNAFLNAPWVKAVLPIRPGQEHAAINWLKHVEGTKGVEPGEKYYGTEDDLAQVIDTLADRIRKKHKKSAETVPFDDVSDDGTKVLATPLDVVYERGFSPLVGGFKPQLNETDDFDTFVQWVEILPTDQIVAVEVVYDPKTGRQV